MLLARVALGRIHPARKVLTGRVLKPPALQGMPCDSVVANLGPMDGHPKNHQDHQELVIFDRAQAYPCYLVYYTTQP